MMVYKYWDSLSITREDLEFSVGSKEAFWEVNDPHLAEEQDEDGSSERYAYPSAVPPMPPPMPSRYSLSNSGSDASECPGFRHQGGHAPSLVGTTVRGVVEVDEGTHLLLGIGIGGLAGGDADIHTDLRPTVWLITSCCTF